MRADEARTACDQEIHDTIIPPMRESSRLIYRVLRNRVKVRRHRSKVPVKGSKKISSRSSVAIFRQVLDKKPRGDFFATGFAIFICQIFQDAAGGTSLVSALAAGCASGSGAVSAWADCT